MIKQLEKEVNLEDVLTNEKTIVVFSAIWCGPCNMLVESIDDYLKENKANFIKVDVDSHTELCKKFGVMSVPTLKLFENKNIIKETTGYLDVVDLGKFITE